MATAHPGSGSSIQFLRWEHDWRRGGGGRGHKMQSQPIRCAEQAAGRLEVPGSCLKL